MRLRLLCLLLSSVVVAALQAQPRDYSYAEDLSFDTPESLIGYSFYPSQMENTADGDRIDLEVGEASLRVRRGVLYVSLNGEETVYTVNTINATEYGFKLSLMGARNALVQGHLKVILKAGRRVEALILKPDKDKAEVIFFLPTLTEAQAAEQDAQYTDRFELYIPATDSLWGKTITPYLEQGRETVKLDPAQPTTFYFEETFEVTDKRKQKKGDPPLVPLDSLSRGELEALADGNRRVKLDKTYTVTIKRTVTTSDGVAEARSDTYEIKSIDIREDDQAVEDQERYQLELQLDNKESLYLYLTIDQAVSSIEMGDTFYLMRGH